MRHFLGLKSLGYFNRLRLKLALLIAPADIALLPMTKDLYERAGEVLELASCQKIREETKPEEIQATLLQECRPPVLRVIAGRKKDKSAITQGRTNGN